MVSFRVISFIVLLLPLATYGGLLRSTNQVAESSASTTRELKKQKECNDVPLRTRSGGDEVNYMRAYASVYMEGDVSNMREFQFCEAFVNAYAGSLDCSPLEGAYRYVNSCRIINDAIGPDPNAYLVKFDYFANVVNGAKVFNMENTPAGQCTCPCKNDVVTGIFAEGVCTCLCEDSNVDCHCEPPTLRFFAWMMDQGIKLVNSGAYSVTGVKPLIVDETCTNGNFTTFNETTICPNVESTHYQYLDTTFPSAFPTQSPTTSPSHSPTISPQPTVYAIPDLEAIFGGSQEDEKKKEKDKNKGK